MHQNRKLELMAGITLSCCSAFKVDVETPQNHHSLDDFEKWNPQTLIPRSLLVWMNSAPSRATSSRIQPIAGGNFSPLQHPKDLWSHQAVVSCVVFFRCSFALCPKCLQHLCRSIRFGDDEAWHLLTLLVLLAARFRRFQKLSQHIFWGKITNESWKFRISRLRMHEMSRESTGRILILALDIGKHIHQSIKWQLTPSGEPETLSAKSHPETRSLWEFVLIPEKPWPFQLNQNWH